MQWAESIVKLGGVAELRQLWYLNGDDMVDGGFAKHLDGW